MNTSLDLALARRRRTVITGRELSDRAIRDQAEALRDYLSKHGTRGASFWLDNKAFAPADRAAILVALGDLEDEAEP